jgi:pristinamycin I synthase-3/4
MLVAMLAVLKAGAAYLAIDPSFPPARIEAMLRAVPPAALLGDRTSLELVRGLCGDLEVTAIDVDPSGGQDEDNGSAPPDDTGAIVTGVTEEDPCFVVFTSGSIGTPRAVSIPHRVRPHPSLFPSLPPDC